MRALASWERFWFEDIPPTSYALLRIVFGIVGLANLVSYTPVADYWPVDAIAPVPGGGTGLRRWLLDSGAGSIAGYAYFTALSAGFLALSAGFCTRWATLLCFVGTIGQKSWNHLPLTSSIEVIAVVLFSLLFVDAGSVLSVDAWRRGQGAPPPDAPIWPLRLVRFQVALLYLNAGLWKLSSEAWRDGTALHYALNHNIFHRFPGALPVSAEWLLTAGTYVTLGWEIAFAFCLWHPVARAIVLVVGVFVHAGIWMTMEVGSFSWVTLATYVAFLNPHGVARQVARFKERALAERRTISPLHGPVNK